MPLRSVKMNRFIFGFHRRVWCPKWTPLSSSCFMLTTAMPCSPSVLRAAWAALLGCRGPRWGPPWRPQHHSPGGGPKGALAGTEVATAPPVRREGERAKSIRRRRIAPTSIPAAGRRPPRAIRPSTDLAGPTSTAGRPERVDGVPARLLLLAVLCLALLAPAPALPEPPPAEPVAAFGWRLAGRPPMT